MTQQKVMTLNRFHRTHKAFKYRIYPSAEQEILINKTFAVSDLFIIKCLRIVRKSMSNSRMIKKY
jgi:hypothetical protein